MPIKDSEKRKRYFRNYMRKLRAKLKRKKKVEKEKEIESEIAKGNLNYGLKPKKDRFMTYKQFKQKYPNKNYYDYLLWRREFFGENKPKPVSRHRGKPIDFSILDEIDLFHGHEKEEEKRKKEQEKGSELKRILEYLEALED